MLPAPAKTKGKKVLKEKPSVTKEQAAAITAAATKRKQEQRAREKAEKEELLRAKKELEDQLDALLQRLLHPVVRLDILPPHVREAVVRNRQLAREGREMRKRVEELHEVVAILTKWTFSFKPHEELKPKPSMMETTLLGHEECRNYGHMWLCEKSLRMALSAHPFEQFKGRVEDDIVSWPHIGEDTNGTSLEALQLHSQYTVMGDYEAVADVVWKAYVRSSPQTNIEVVDFVHTELIYCCGKYGPLRPSFLNLTALFRLKHRIVITITTIAYDERFPLRDGESRPHGFGWTILDEMAQGVTLCRQSYLQYTPVNKERPLTLEEIGRLVHYELKEKEPRENVIAKYQQMVEDGFIMQRDLLIRAQFPIV